MKLIVKLTPGIPEFDQYLEVDNESKFCSTGLPQCLVVIVGRARSTMCSQIER